MCVSVCICVSMHVCDIVSVSVCICVCVPEMPVPAHRVRRWQSTVLRHCPHQYPPYCQGGLLCIKHKKTVAQTQEKDIFSLHPCERNCPMVYKSVPSWNTRKPKINSNMVNIIRKAGLWASSSWLAERPRFSKSNGGDECLPTSSLLPRIHSVAQRQSWKAAGTRSSGARRYSTPTTKHLAHLCHTQASVSADIQTTQEGSLLFKN